MSNTTKEVRQVLMNELGITRELVREELRKIVEVEAAKLVSQGHLERIVGEKFNELAKVNKWAGRESILPIIENAAKITAERFMRENLRFEIKKNTENIDTNND
jgi:competence protein ComGF